MSVDLNQLNFETSMAGEIDRATVKVRNRRKKGAVTVSAEASPPFRIVGLPTTVQPRSESEITVEFAPQQPGRYMQSVVFWADRGRSATIELIGTFIEADASVSEPDASVSEPDASANEPDVSVSEPDARVNEPDASVSEPDGSVVQIGKPGAGNTGVPTGVTLKPYQGDCWISTDNATFDAVDFSCRVVIAASNVKITRSRIRGGLLVNERPGFILEDSTLNAGMGISSSSDVTLRRNNIHGPDDSIHITSDGNSMCARIILEGNWIHDPQPSQDDHYDAIQVRGVRGLTLRGNNLDSGPWQFPHNAVIYLENANGGNSDVTIDHNWLNGGGYMLYINGANVEITNNKIGRDYHWGLLYAVQAPFVEYGNVFEDNGEPVVFQ